MYACGSLTGRSDHMSFRIRLGNSVSTYEDAIFCFACFPKHAVVRSIRAPILRMSNQWLRAFRSVAQNPRQSRLLSQPTRSSYSTTPNQAPDDRKNTPRDNGSEPEHETSNGDTEGEENVFGEKTAITNGESQGRKRPANGLRSRASRNRKSDLPPVQIPKSFLGLSIHRHGEKSKKWDQSLLAEDDQYHNKRLQANTAASFEAQSKIVLEETAWSPSAIEELREALRLSLGRGDIHRISRRMDVFSATAYSTLVHHVKRGFGDDAHSKILESGLERASSRWAESLLLTTYPYHEDRPVIYDPKLHPLILESLLYDGEVKESKIALYEPCIIDEVITAVRVELLIRPPDNTRLAGLRRPTTIINVQDCSAFSVARDALQDVAEKLEADVLHLQAADIAHIVGRYVGQDVTRTPGEISLLGYRAAENSGRLKSHSIMEEEEREDDDASGSGLTFLLQGKVRRDARRQTMSIEDFLQPAGTRGGKSDELWEDVKINAALDELVNSAHGDGTDKKPLIIHIHDFNALNMDNTGATIVGKIQKIVDDLWLSGRKIALVGSCSSHGAPKLYQTALGVLETTDRVIHLSQRSNHNEEVRAHCRATLDRWEMEDNLRENDENIVRMLWSMTESSGFISTHSERTLGLNRLWSMGEGEPNSLIKGAKANRPHWAKYTNSVLPVSEIYRTATAMVDLNSTSDTELFDMDCFEEAAIKLAAVDAVKEKATKLQKSHEVFERASKGDVFIGTKKDPSGENHEERLLSGLVNARDMRTTFKDIHAPPETIEAVKMLTTLSLIRPEAFSYGVLATDRIPGLLLYGPPGTGKTLIAKAVAKESGANMIEVSGASLINKYVGESAKTVRALFSIAKKKEPMVIFIDEADVLLAARGDRTNGGRREVINQFLREWDGMNKTKAFIMVATNRPFDLDEAVLRRLPRRLLVDLPLEADRAAILKIHLKGEDIDETVSIEGIAKNTPLYSGSDLKNVCVAAAMAAVKEEIEASERHTGPEPFQWTDKRVLSRRHFDKALKEISASSSEDMSTLTAIRKFDERYGDGKARKKRRGMGFEVVPEARDSEQARVRNGR